MGGTTSCVSSCTVRDEPLASGAAPAPEALPSVRESSTTTKAAIKHIQRRRLELGLVDPSDVQFSARGQPRRIPIRHRENATGIYDSINLCEYRNLCCSETHLSGMQDPNRVHGYIDTGMIDIDGDGVQVLDFCSAVFMDPPDRQKGRPPVPKIEANTFRNNLAAFHMHAEEEEEVEAAPFKDYSRCCTADHRSLQDPMMVQGEIQTGIIDFDGDGIEPGEFVSAIFMGYPAESQGENFPKDKEIFVDYQKNFTHWLDIKADLEEQALANPIAHAERKIAAASEPGDWHYNFEEPELLTWTIRPRASSSEETTLPLRAV